MTDELKETRCAIVLASGLTDGLRWQVQFQVRPHMAVIVEGEKPSLEQWMEVAGNIAAPFPALQALYVAACVEWDRVTGKKAEKWKNVQNAME